LEEPLVEKAKQLGLNISQIVNETLRFIINTGHYQPLIVELSLIEMKSKQLEDLKANSQQNIKQLDKLIDQLRVQKSLITRLVSESEKDGEIAKLYQKLIELCSIHQYDPKAVWDDSEAIRDRLSSLGIEYGYLDFTLYVRTVERGSK